VGEFGGMVIRQQEAARGEADPPRFHQSLGDQQIGGGMRLPGRGMVLADPGLDKAELVGPAQRLKIPTVSLEQRALRRMRGHCEQAVLHGALPSHLSAFLTIRQKRSGPIRPKKLYGSCRFSRNWMVAERLILDYL